MKKKYASPTNFPFAKAQRKSFRKSSPSESKEIRKVKSSQSPIICTLFKRAFLSFYNVMKTFQTILYVQHRCFWGWVGCPPWRLVGQHSPNTPGPPPPVAGTEKRPKMQKKNFFLNQNVKAQIYRYLNLLWHNLSQIFIGRNIAKRFVSKLRSLGPVDWKINL